MYVCVLIILNNVAHFNFRESNENTTTTTTTTVKTTKVTTQKLVPDLPELAEAEEEHQKSLTIFFILLVIGKIRQADKRNYDDIQRI